jgi:hypothetical protein
MRSAVRATMTSLFGDVFQQLPVSIPTLVTCAVLLLPVLTTVIRRLAGATDGGGSLASVSDALASARDASARRFCAVLTRHLVYQAANGRSDYDFYFSPLGLWVEFETFFGIFTVPTLASYWSCVDSQGSRDVVKQILEAGPDDARARAATNAAADAAAAAADASLTGVASAAHSSPFYATAARTAAATAAQQQSAAPRGGNGALRVDWSVHGGYDGAWWVPRLFKPKWVLTCRWDRPELTRAREYGGR